ncbi:MAG: PAS domain S-box protein [Planctomycetota bacterium]|nr:MAG: PAS domain S-box protein [Planctomycetota bacterium]
MNPSGQPERHLSIEPNDSTWELREAQLRTLLDAAAEGLYGLDLEGRCTFANRACAQMLGYEGERELLGKNMHDLIHYAKADGSPFASHVCPILRAYRHGEQVHVDNDVFWKKGGESFPVEYWSYPICSTEGLVVGAVVTFIDISERLAHNRAEERVRRELEHRLRVSYEELGRTQNRLNLALEYGNVGLWDWDLTTNDVYYSPTFKSQLGYTQDDSWAAFGDWEAHLHPDDHDAAVQRVKDYFADPTRPYISKFRLQCRDGSYKWILSQGKAHFDAQGRPVRMIGVHIDITQQEEYDKKLEQLNNELSDTVKELKRANEELRQFAYVASHDLQTPLRSITGFAQLLAEDCLSDADDVAADYLRRIIRSAARMQRLIHDLLQLSRIDSRPRTSSPVDLGEVVSGVLHMLGDQIAQEQAVIDVSPLPTILGDATQMEQLFQNLLVNAINYRSSQRRLSVRVWYEMDGEHCRVHVRDNGIGIAPEYHEQVFEAFRRLHREAERPGTGIGLAICRKIAERHGGRIELESEPDRGSTFTVVLPKELVVSNA